MANVTDYLPNASLVVVNETEGEYNLNIVVSLPSGFCIESVDWDDTRGYEGMNPVCSYPDAQIRKVTVEIANDGSMGGLVQEQGTITKGSDLAVEIVVKEDGTSRGRNVQVYNQANM